MASRKPLGLAVEENQQPSAWTESKIDREFARIVKRSGYWQEGPPIQKSPHRGALFAPRIGPRPYPEVVYEEDEACPWKPKKEHNSLQAINLVTGHLGSGKSYYAVRKMFQYLRAGKYVMANFDLYGPWWSTVVDGTYSRKEKYRVRREAASATWEKNRYERMRYVLRHCWRFYDQSELFDYVLPGNPQKEDRGLLVVDEAALRNNARTGKERQEKAAAVTGDAQAEFEWFVHMRKLGWTCLMLTQDSEMVDKQLRGTTSSEVHLRNLQKVTIPLLGIPMARKPTFIAVYYWHEGAKKGKPIDRDYYGLDVQIANHYKSNHRFSRRAGEEGRMHMMFDYDGSMTGQSVPFDPEIPVLGTATTTSGGASGTTALGGGSTHEERGTSDEEEDDTLAARPRSSDREEEELPWLPDSYGEEDE